MRSGSAEDTLSMSDDESGWPGSTIQPFGAMTCFGVMKEIPPLCFTPPWQAEQCALKMGRIWLPKSMAVGASSASACAVATANTALATTSLAVCANTFDK